MKKFTRFFATVAAVSMVAASLTGCGSKSDNTASTDTTADSATAGDTLKIGGIGPITGGAAVYGLAVKNAAELAVKEINEAGGINGMQVEFKFEDDEHDAEKSVNAYNSLKDWGMQMLMGTVTSTPCTAVVEKTHEDNMFQLTPSGSAVESIKYDNAFRVCFSDPGQGTASAKYIGENKLASKVAVIYNSSDVYSSGIYQKFAEEAKNQDFEVVSAEAFTEDSKTDFSVQLQKAKDAGADMVFLPIYYTEASLIGVFIARNPDSSVFQIVSFAWAGFGASFGPLVLLALFWKRSTFQGALCGMVSGGVMVFVWKFLIRPMGGALGIYELLPAFLLGLAVNVIVSLLTPAPSREVQDEFDKVASMK